MTYGDNVLDFFYDINGVPVAMRHGYASSANYVVYYYITNLQGDVVRLVDIYGNTAAYYEYDAFGNVLEASGSHANINPLRYRGYVYDTDTGFYYLQSRYYDPKVGRFINADSYTSTGQGILGNNMFAYCLNNPVLLSDPFGAMARDSLLLPHILDDNVNNNRGKRDVTDEVLSVLTEAARQARSMRATANQHSLLSFKHWEIVGSIYTEFLSLVDHGAPWDIKRQKVWESTIGTEHPGEGTEVIFAGNIMTPESLGNFTYGYLGYAYGIPLEILIGGSYYAARFPAVRPHGNNSRLSNEINDWSYIKMGYEYAQNGHL